MKKKLIVIDGNSIVNRAFYGVRALTASDGLPTNAVYGTVSIIEKHLENIKPDYAAIAFDLREPTFRHKLYDGYKATRHGMPEELAVQMPYVKDTVRAMGLHVLEMAGYEADDILGTLSTFADDNTEVYIITGDRDSLQLIGDGVSVLLATNKDTVKYDRSRFFEEYGIEPAQFVDTKALMGDSSDNIPGVTGIGPKTALSLIAKFGSLDGVYASLDDSTITKTQRAKLETDKDKAYLSRELAEIFKNVPLGINIDALAYEGFDKSALKALFERLEFFAFIKRFRLDEVKAEASECCACEENEVTLDYLLTLPKDEPIALWCEDGITLYNGKQLMCVCGDLLSIAPLLEDKERKIICYDSKKIYKTLFNVGRSFDACHFDVMLGAYAHESTLGSYELYNLATKYLGTLDAPPAVKVYMLYEKLSALICENGEEHLMYDIEMPLSAVLAEMENVGFKIDRAGMENFGRSLRELEAALTERIYFLAGCEFNINSPKQLGEVLFEKLGLPAGKKTKTGYSTNVDVLNSLRPYHEIIGEILDYRQVTKLRATYADGLVAVADERGRIHSYFKQTGTATGRLSSAEPNLQNIPIRTELGREMRKYFVADDGYVLIDADYSQIELRLLAHISDDDNMRDAFLSGKDIHTSTASAVFGVPIDEVTSELRKRAKAVNFGIVYGIGDFTLSQDIGTSRAEAKRYIESYLASYPKIDAYLKNIIAEAYEAGYVSTIVGRRRYITELSAQNKMTKKFGERVAMNSPIQGSAADIIKIAMINVAKKLKEEGLDARLILQVHDELIVEANKNCAERAYEILKYEMENAVKLSVPLDVDISVAENWYNN